MQRVKAHPATGPLVLLHFEVKKGKKGNDDLTRRRSFFITCANINT